MESADPSTEGPDSADRYRRFAQREARGLSPAYERLAAAVAADPALTGRLDALEGRLRQPNLLFGAARLLGGPVLDPPAFAAWAAVAWDDLVAVMRRRRTQTNEPGRCATLLPFLAALPQPLALLEVGASAGLCLYPDRYGYRFDGSPVGPAGPVVLDCALDGVAAPAAPPTVVWRAGLDLNPLDVTEPDDVRWLDALIWPEQQHRRDRLRAAAAVAAAEPATLVRGDLLTGVPALAARAPRDATLVVFHSAVVAYVPAGDRARFAAAARELPGHWIANEAPGIVADVPVDGPGFVVAVDGRPVAVADPHGAWLRALPVPAAG